MVSLFEPQSKPGIKMVNPEPCTELRRRSYLWLGSALTDLHLPGFEFGLCVYIYIYIVCITYVYINIGINIHSYIIWF